MEGGTGLKGWHDLSPLLTCCPCKHATVDPSLLSVQESDLQKDYPTVLILLWTVFNKRVLKYLRTNMIS